MNKSSIALTVTVVVAVTASPARSQEPSASLSLEEAFDLFGRNSPELRMARSRLRSELGSVRQSRAIPNPTASITNEDLGQYSERYFNVSQRVDFIWEARSRGRRAEARASEARAAFQADSLRMGLEMKRAFVDAWLLAQVVSALTEVDGAVAEVLEDAAVRFADGDLAGYDLRRLRVARASVGRRLARADVSLTDAERKLGSLVAGDGPLSRVQAEAPTLGPSQLPPDLVAVDRALARRPELAAARAATEALDAEAGLVRRSWLVGTALTAGFKKQSDGRSGLFLGLQLPVPLLDRRRGAVDAAEAEVDRSESESQLLRLAVAREASLAHARFQSASRQRALWGDGGIGEATDLLSIARVAYEEGEVGIVELVDAADAFLEARLLDSSVRAEVWIAFFELEHAIGGLPREVETGVER